MAICITILKTVFYICNIGVLIWWTIYSIQTYIESPTASKVEMKYGEDGDGNVRFPVVTICPEIRSIDSPNTTKLWMNQRSCRKVLN